MSESQEGTGGVGDGARDRFRGWFFRIIAQGGLRVGLGRSTRVASEPVYVTRAGADEVTVRFIVPDTGVVVRE